MNARTLIIGILAAAVVGCGQPTTTAAGTWVGTYRGSPMTLHANADSSFTLESVSPIKGRWQLDGNDLKLFRDVSNGGDIGFGEGGDGASHFTLSADGKTLTGEPVNNQPTILTKK